MHSSPDSNLAAPASSHHGGRASSKVLIVDNDPHLIQVLHTALKNEGFEVTIAHDGIEALKAMQVERPDLVILNTALPWLGNVDVRQESRALPQAGGPAIIALNNKGKTADMRGPKGEADDYLAKPFSTKELLARVKALQHRTSIGTLRAGPIEMDLLHGTVRVGGRQISLTGKEFNLLRRLLEAKGRILTRSILRETVWEHEFGHRFDTRTVDVHVGRLRRKLGPAGRYIITVRGTGYRCFS
ncbi:MAG TPA: response regulator transcription factor [Burkholderiales bacterium]|nr:response regulator transcription factor [Burkholderiales bacterium]